MNLPGLEVETEVVAFREVGAVVKERYTNGWGMLSMHVDFNDGVPISTALIFIKQDTPPDLLQQMIETMQEEVRQKTQGSQSIQEQPDESID